MTINCFSKNHGAIMNTFQKSWMDSTQMLTIFIGLGSLNAVCKAQDQIVASKSTFRGKLGIFPSL